MIYELSRQDQDKLLRLAAEATSTMGWKTDAVAFSIHAKDEDVIKAIGVYEDFTMSREATFSFALMNAGRGMTRGLIDAFVNLSFHHRALDLHRLWMQAAADNIASQTAMLKLGAGFEYRRRGGIMREVAGAIIPVDAIMFSLVNPKFAAPAARAPEQLEE